MNTYETIIIFDHRYDGKVTLKESINAVAEILDKHCKLKIEEIGEKQLAYPIKEAKTGYYVVFTWKGYTDDVTTLETHAHADPHILKFITVKKEDGDYEIEDAEYIPDHPEKDVKSEQSSTIDALDVMLGLAEYKKEVV